MAASSPTVLAHVAWMLRGSFEDLAVEALGYIPNCSETARDALSEVLAEGGPEVSSFGTVETQATEETGATPDLACLDSEGEKPVLIEAKFDAPLTKNQPVEYLRHLPTDRSSVLLVVAPERRLKWLWEEMSGLVRDAGDLEFGEGIASESLKRASVGNGRTLMVVSWKYLLDRIALRAGEKTEEATLRSVRELQGVVEYEDLNAFVAPSKELAELDEKNKGRFKKLIDEAIAKGRNEEWANTEGYGVGGGVTGYVRYFAIGDVSMWFGYDLRMWEQYGGPLWVGFQERAQNNIGIVRKGLRELCVKRPENFYHDVPSWSRRRDYIRINLPCSSEYQELLKSLLEQLCEIAEALKKVELPD